MREFSQPCRDTQEKLGLGGREAALGSPRVRGRAGKGWGVEAGLEISSLRAGNLIPYQCAPVKMPLGWDNTQWTQDEDAWTDLPTITLVSVGQTVPCNQKGEELPAQTTLLRVPLQCHGSQKFWGFPGLMGLGFTGPHAPCAPQNSLTLCTPMLCIAVSWSPGSLHPKSQAQGVPSALALCPPMPVPHPQPPDIPNPSGLVLPSTHGSVHPNSPDPGSQSPSSVHPNPGALYTPIPHAPQSPRSLSHSCLPNPHSQLPVPFPAPQSPFPAPQSPFPAPQSPFPAPQSPFPLLPFPFPAPQSPCSLSHSRLPNPLAPFPIPGSPVPIPGSPFPSLPAPFPAPQSPGSRCLRRLLPRRSRQEAAGASRAGVAARRPRCRRRGPGECRGGPGGSGGSAGRPRAPPAPLPSRGAAARRRAGFRGGRGRNGAREGARNEWGSPGPGRAAPGRWGAAGYPRPGAGVGGTPGCLEIPLAAPSWVSGAERAPRSREEGLAPLFCAETTENPPSLPLGHGDIPNPFLPARIDPSPRPFLLSSIASQILIPSSFPVLYLKSSSLPPPNVTPNPHPFFLPSITPNHFFAVSPQIPSFSQDHPKSLLLPSINPKSSPLPCSLYHPKSSSLPPSQHHPKSLSAPSIIPNPFIFPSSPQIPSCSQYHPKTLHFPSITPDPPPFSLPGVITPDPRPFLTPNPAPRTPVGSGGCVPALHAPSPQSPTRGAEGGLTQAPQ
ncbi:hypothetical protein DV515_00017656, partial [Chloebia gouldiae]